MVENGASLAGHYGTCHRLTSAAWRVEGVSSVWCCHSERTNRGSGKLYRTGWSGRGTGRESAASDAQRAKDARSGEVDDAGGRLHSRNLL